MEHSTWLVSLLQFLKGNSTTVFGYNTAALSGGAIYSFNNCSFNNCSITFNEYSNTTLFNNNGIFYGGGVVLHKTVSITFAGHSQITLFL